MPAKRDPVAVEHELLCHSYMSRQRLRFAVIGQGHFAQVAVAAPQARKSLSHMAQVWLRLADNYEARPVVQQQQQIQPKKE